MNKKQMIESMFELQDQFNKKVDQDWDLKGREWYRAIIAECVELQEMLGFKWWLKSAPADPFQARLEVVDIFAFSVSDIIASKSVSMLVISKAIDEAQSDCAILDQIDIFMDEIFTYRGFSVFSLISFAKICKCFGLGFKDLYRLYIAKTALNHHRQHNGYKTGGYQKMWQGRQDNQHLEELFIQLSDVADENLLNEMTVRLQQRYSAMVGK